MVVLINNILVFLIHGNDTGIHVGSGRASRILSPFITSYFQDRVYVKNNKVDEVQDLGLKLFKELVSQKKLVRN